MQQLKVKTTNQTRTKTRTNKSVLTHVFADLSLFDRTEKWKEGGKGWRICGSILKIMVVRSEREEETDLMRIQNNPNEPNFDPSQIGQRTSESEHCFPSNLTYQTTERNVLTPPFHFPCLGYLPLDFSFSSISISQNLILFHII